ERDGEPDLLDREDRERVGDGPEAARERGPDHEVRRLTHVVPHGCGAAYQSGEAPARQEHAEHHNEGNDHRGDAERHELSGRLRPGSLRSCGVGTRVAGPEPTPRGNGRRLNSSSTWHTTRSAGTIASVSHSRSRAMSSSRMTAHDG